MKLFESSIWRFVNSPIFIFLLAAVALPVALVCTVSIIERRERTSPSSIEDPRALSEKDKSVSGKLSFSNLALEEYGATNTHRIIGTLTNGSDATLQNIHIDVSIYARDGTLLSLTEASPEVRYLQPQESLDFAAHFSGSKLLTKGTVLQTLTNDGSLVFRPRLNRFEMVGHRY